MSLRLILMRHAKSAWDDLTLDDHDRHLNQRGCDSADAMGDWLRAHRIMPDLALVSSAQRTQETFQRLRLDVPMQSSRALYLASTDRMMDLIQGQPVHTLLVLGHNPGIGELAERLVRSGPADERFLQYPTGATAIMRFDTPSWGDISFGMGQLEQFMVPRDLPQKG